MVNGAVINVDEALTTFVRSEVQVETGGRQDELCRITVFPGVSPVSPIWTPSPLRIGVDNLGRATGPPVTLIATDAFAVAPPMS